MSARPPVRNAWDLYLVVARGLLLSQHDLSLGTREALAQHPGPDGVLPGPVEDETGGGRFAVLALTLTPRMRMVAGSLLSRRCYQERGRSGAKSSSARRPSSGLPPARSGSSGCALQRQ